ncbi:MAG TPA: bifunctional hydroxymethylpyrimidine kinase/phosphomethylpyrimidine kinase [Armatimonadota bacterium]|nr:bifunctional hydroxymethylpyrimidine kinase/phosphomethylpyrimidine kinase [Armatimonadota bacterium]
MRSVLTIAASDPSGGAGVQADLRVFDSQGAAGLSAITAITVQNTWGVRSVAPTPASLLQEQLDAILSDSSPAAVKIGLLPDATAAHVVAGALDRYRPPNVILDPVLASSGGLEFLSRDGEQALREVLLPLCDLATPNLIEAARLTAHPVDTESDRMEVARRLCAMGARAALIKGGHLEGAPVDLLLDSTGAFHLFRGVRIDTPHTHGTGCFLSSAIAARLALGDSLKAAIRCAKSLLEEGLRSPVIIGQGRGSPYPGAFDPAGRTHSERLALLRGVYLLTDPNFRGDLSSEEIARQAIAGGARVIQLRDKRLSTPDLIREARILASIARETGALFIVNDRVDVALASGADGVHVGPDDMTPADARRLLGSDRLLGVSVGTVAEALEAARHASYLAVGAIFGSKTKLDAGEPVGPQRIAEIRAAVPDLPLVAIGGISRDNLAVVIAAGASSAAVISAVLGKPDITAATRELAELFH